MATATAAIKWRRSSWAGVTVFRSSNRMRVWRILGTKASRARGEMRDWPASL
jgi:hypothetical protein